MAAIDFSGVVRGHSVVQDLLDALSAAWRHFAKARAARRDLVAISRLGPRLIRDIGLDPEEVYTELDGSWDAVAPVGYRILLPRDAHLKAARPWRSA